jgi:RNA polymerase sigma-70 factor (ECF subfamily)
LVDGLRVDKKASRDSEYTAPTESPDERSVKDIATLLARLPENQRNAVELRYMDEKTFEQIAESLNTSSQNARKIVSRAVAKLKNLVNGSGENP